MAVSTPHSQSPYLAYGLWDPEPTAVVGQTHSDLQAYSVSHRDIEGLGAAVMALQRLWGEGGQAWLGCFPVEQDQSQGGGSEYVLGGRKELTGGRHLQVAHGVSVARGGRDTVYPGWCRTCKGQGLAHKYMCAGAALWLVDTESGQGTAFGPLTIPRTVPELPIRGNVSPPA